MKKLLTQKWLISGFIIVMTLTLAFQGVDPSGGYHPYPTSTPQPPATPTLTPTPTLQACQVQEIFFNEQRYSPGQVITAKAGDPLKVTLRLADAAGQPLIGANVDATVTRQDLPVAQTAASAIPPLVDQSGTYDGVYTQTETPGEYTFKFLVTDFSGPRFLPCVAEGKVRVEAPPPPPPACQMTVTASGGQQLNDPLRLTATVTVNGQPQTDATVTTSVRRPDNVSEGPLPFGSNNPYTLTYPKTNVAGNYTFFALQASDASGRFVSCTAPDITIPISDTPVAQCRLTPLQFDQPQYTPGQTINFTSTLTKSSGITLTVTATAKRPNEPPQPLTLTNAGMTYSGRYTRTTITGTYEFKLTAKNSAEAEICTIQGTRPVIATTPTLTPTVRVAPPVLTTTLCSLRETSAVILDQAVNVVRVQLELSYDPQVIQVIDADRQQRGVQVRYDGPFSVDAIEQNEVDTRNGRIFFTAHLIDGRTLNGTVGLIGIDWRPQRVGNSTVKLERVVLTNAAGQVSSPTRQSGAVQVNFVPNCRTGTAALQGRVDYSGVVVTNSAGEQVQTGADGYFALVGVDTLTFAMPGYLATQADVRQNLAATENDQVAHALGTITLLVGDVNADNRIDILDLAYIAQRYQSTDPTADLNADGLVDIIDLALAASNYGE